MKGITITSENEPIQLGDIPKPVYKIGHALVKIKHASLNRRDQWIREGKYPDIRLSAVLG